MKISIITVALNAEDTIERCVTSVLEQSYQNLEIVVVDGVSDDNTLEILQKIADPRLLVISEKDNGIYDAMNKGAALATGEYLLFLNSDDWLYDSEVISKIFENIRQTEYDLIVAKTIIAIKDKVYLQSAYPNSQHEIRGLNIPHPSSFILTDLFRSYQYDTNYKFAGDYDLWIRLLKIPSLEIKYVDIISSCFSLGGISTKGGTEGRIAFEVEVSKFLNGGSASVQTIVRRFLIGHMKYFLFKFLSLKIYYEVKLKFKEVFK